MEQLKITVPRLVFPGHKKDVSDSGYWFEEGDDAWRYFSSLGYSFARSLQPELGVPVGVISCNWGGSSASIWMDESWLSQEPLDVYLKEYEAAVAGKDPEELKAASIRAFAVEDSLEHRTEWAAVMYGISLAEQREWMKRPAGPVNPMGPYNVGRPSGMYHQMLVKELRTGAALFICTACSVWPVDGRHRGILSRAAPQTGNGGRKRSRRLYDFYHGSWDV